MSTFGQGNVNVNISGNAQGLVAAMNQADQSVKKTTTSIQQGTDKAGKSTQGLAEKFSGNRGLIYSMGTIFGTITGVVAEFALLEEANNSVAEATDKLRVMEERGEQGTQKYAQTQQELDKALRFQRFTWRNLALAVTNFIPEILLLATGLSKAKVAADTASKSTQALATAEKATAAATAASATVQKAASATMTTSSAAVKELTVANVALKDAEIASGEAAVVASNTTRRALIRTGIGALLVAAGTALLAFIENWGKFRDKVNEAGEAIGKFAPILKPVLDLMAQFGHWIAQVLGNEVPTATDDAAKGFKGLSKEAVQAAEDVKKAWDDTITDLQDMKVKERKDFLKELGFDKNGVRKLEYQIEITQDRKQILENLTKGLALIYKFKPSPSVQKEFVNNQIESIRDAMKDAQGKLSDLNPLLQILKDHKNDPDLGKYVGEWLATLTPDQLFKFAQSGIDILELLKGLGIDPAKLGPKAKELLTGVVDPSGVKVVKEDKKGGLVDEFIKSINNADWSKAWTSFQQAVISTGDWLKAQLVVIGAAILTFFTTYDWGTAWISFQDAMVSTGTWIQAQLVKIGAAILQFFVTYDWGTAWQTFKDAMVSTGEWIGAGLVKIGAAILNFFALFDWNKAWELFQADMVGLGDWIQAGLITIGNAILEFFKTAPWDKSWEIFHEQMVAGGEWIGAGLFTIGTAIKTFFEKVPWGDYWKFFQDMMFAGGTWIGTQLTAIGNEIKTKLQGGVAALQNAGAALWGQITSGIMQSINVNAFTDMAGAFINALVGAIGGLTDAGSRILKAILGALGLEGQAAFKKDNTPIISSISQETINGVKTDTGGTDTRDTTTKNLDVMNRQFLTIAQTIKVVVAAYNVLAKATLVVNADILKLIGSNNVYAKTLVVVAADSNALVKSNNVLAKTLVTVSQDVGAGVKQNNVYAKTIVTVTKDVSAWTKANNTLARTITTVSKDVGAAVKQMNVFARALVTVGKDAASAAKDVKTLASAINGLKSKTVTLTTVKKTVAAHTTSANLDSNLNAHASSNGMLNVTIVNEDEFGQKKLKRFKSQLGKESYRFA